MMLIDSHLHLWDPRGLSYPWLSGLPALNHPHLPEQLADIEGAPDMAIVVQADCLIEQALDEVIWLHQVAEHSPITLAGIVASAPLEQGEAVRPFLRQLREWPLVVGIRRSLQNEPLERFYDAGYRDGVLAVAQEGWVIDLCIRANQLLAANDLLNWLFRHCPQARVVLDHMGKPDIAQSHFEEWRQGIDRITAYPNVYCKISGLPTEADWQHWTTEQLAPWILHAIDAFGAERCLFGGDWPVVNLAGGYTRWRQCVEKTLQLAPLTVQERAGIMAENARRIYSLSSGG
ncbi:amidohydrolase family protein [Kluyvera georgiana]|uniref:amidohydrolase family protein n=1 Tax=Kluyvera georgiana TaxID=73098 RepID=UPI00321F92AA